MNGLRPLQPNPPPAMPGWKLWLWPLRSRKVQVALATVIVAYTGQIGLAISEETMTTLLGVSIALILGIAVEDAGKGR